jgi:hypothetical protein
VQALSVAATCCNSAIRAYRSKLSAHQGCLKPRKCSGGLMRYRFAPCCGPCSVDLSELALRGQNPKIPLFQFHPAGSQLAMVSMHGINCHRHVATAASANSPCFWDIRKLSDAPQGGLRACHVRVQICGFRKRLWCGAGCRIVVWVQLCLRPPVDHSAAATSVKAVAARTPFAWRTMHLTRFSYI